MQISSISTDPHLKLIKIIPRTRNIKIIFNGKINHSIWRIFLEVCTSSWNGFMLRQCMHVSKKASRHWILHWRPAIKWNSDQNIVMSYCWIFGKNVLDNAWQMTNDKRCIGDNARITSNAFHPMQSRVRSTRAALGGMHYEWWVLVCNASRVMSHESCISNTFKPKILQWHYYIKIGMNKQSQATVEIWTLYDKWLLR